ncbi:hypothetical protein Ddye_016856 [Dipteronia dyeriana]|uniref:RNase H type-1 domain-containing protein n=1 Tax=Dipteronia dyeriana TaxID=168575 RepID=A0AAD9X0Q0_9ROSI|nr:hypothetical protein Ddye_016856 [Dipteronia dyeriana]
MNGYKTSLKYHVSEESYYQSANDFSGGLEVAVRSEVVKWRPPVDGFYKINTDAALVRGKTVVGVGAVIRNHLGQVMASTAQRLKVSLVPSVIESDALGVVSLINSGYPNLTELGLVCGDIAKHIQDRVITTVSFVPGKTNTKPNLKLRLKNLNSIIQPSMYLLI